VSNLDKDQNVFARDDRRRLFALGNRLWHSDSSFKVVPAKHARSVPSKGGNRTYGSKSA
jgi:alpha-ketoglutarate-dependent 2,4-dichlorophenoxyacetate dioxygenase